MPTCKQCEKPLGWEVDYCPFCGSPQIWSESTSIIATPVPTQAHHQLDESVFRQAPSTVIRTKNAKLKPIKNPNSLEEKEPLSQKEKASWFSLFVVFVMSAVTLGMILRDGTPDTQSNTVKPSIPTASNNPPSVPLPAAAINPIIPEMVFVAAGCFDMGSPDDEVGRGIDERQHQVCLNGFHIGKYEVTFDEYDRFARDTQRPLPKDDGYGRSHYPVFRISWIDAYEYAAWLSKKTGQHYRLPTEAEWEYAARGGAESSKFNVSDLACSYMHHVDCPNSLHHAVPIGTYKPNPLGIYDMLGNIAELTGSAYDMDYQGGETALVATDNRAIRIMRGGSWAHDLSSLRFASRDKTKVDKTHNLLGFRLARD